MSMASEKRAPQRQVHVLLTLHNGERSFGMSLAQRSSAIGPKYTVVSSVFANSPADRAGVRTGYVVRSINDKPTNGLTVAQVASHFRNASQARITLEVVETAASPRTSAFTAQATFGGQSTLSSRSAGQAAAPRASTEQRAATPVTGFSAVSSGRAIAAPGTALSVPSVAAPKQPVLRLGAKPAAKTLAAAGAASSATARPAASTTATTNGRLAMPAADAKGPRAATKLGTKSIAVAPVLRLGPNPKPAQTDTAKELVGCSAKQVDPAPQAKGVLARGSSASATGNGSARGKAAQSSVSAVATSSSSRSAQATPAPANATTSAARVKPKPTPSAPAVAVAAASSSTTVAPAPAAKTTTPSTPATSKLASRPASRPVVVPAATVATKSAAVPIPVASSASAQPSPASERETTVNSTAPVPVAKPASTVASSLRPAKASSQAPAVPASLPATMPLPRSVQTPVAISPKPAPPQPSRVVVTPPTHPLEPPEVSARRRRPPPVILPMPKADPVMNRIPPPVPTPVRTTIVTRSAPAPVAPAAAASSTTKSKTGKKRGRPRKNAEASNGTSSRKGKGKAKAKRPQPREESDDELEEDVVDEDLSAFFPFYSLSDEEESPSRKRGRRRGVPDRPRHSLTVERLVGMGFTQEDAEASVKENGDDPDECMLWIISKIEERQFTNDLNEASKQSEESKRAEVERMKEMEEKALAHVETFMTIFPTSYLAGADSSAPRLKEVLESSINQVSAESLLRKVLTDLLTLEGKAIRWYKQAARSYMLQLAERLETALGVHEVITCCSSSSAACGFVKQLVDEVKALKKALFEMPTNQGGVPPVFLECDETTKFDLDDDGFEVVE